MTSDNILKQVAKFEKEVQKLEKCNDSMCDNDWIILEEKLNQLPGTRKKMAKLASQEFD